MCFIAHNKSYIKPYFEYTVESIGLNNIFADILFKDGIIRADSFKQVN